MSNKITSYGSGFAGSQSNLALANIDNESQANLPLNQDVGAVIMSSLSEIESFIY
jgi:hypothetical protein